MTTAAPGPDNTTRIYLGCSVAFLSVFLVVGLFAAFAALAGRASDRGVALGVGIAFVVVAGGGLLLVRWVWREAARREHRRQMAPDQPWAWKHD